MSLTAPVTFPFHFLLYLFFAFNGLTSYLDKTVLSARDIQLIQNKLYNSRPNYLSSLPVFSVRHFGMCPFLASTDLYFLPISAYYSSFCVDIQTATYIRIFMSATEPQKPAATSSSRCVLLLPRPQRQSFPSSQYASHAESE